MTYEDQTQTMTIGEAEALVNATGTYRGAVVEFSDDDGVTWTEAWSPKGDILHPTHARTTVKRKHEDGDVNETRSTIRWDEYVPPVDNEMHEVWLRKPTTLFGAASKMSSLRGAYRHILGNNYEPSELQPQPAAKKEPSEPWADLIAAAKTPAAVRKIHARMVAAVEQTEELADAASARLAELEPKVVEK